MILKELTTDHYVVVDDSEIKVGDMSLLIVDEFAPMILAHFEPVQEGYIGKKITHSTQPIERFNWMGNSEKGYDTIKPLSLQEVKELISEVDVEKNMWYERNVQNPYSSDSLLHTGFNKGFELGYNQAIEDKKDKKYTEEDMKECVKSILRDLNKHNEIDKPVNFVWTDSFKKHIQSLQPKTEWEVEFDENGKLRLI